jgi:CubicO group peptidase (beta-lactamase class C family)/lysophospholipase L1-like esterase
MHKRFLVVLVPALLALLASRSSRAADPPITRGYFPPPESQGGWQTALPATGEPDDQQKAAIAQLGVNYDRLKEAWDYNARADGATGLIVIRKGVVVGEWYRDCDRSTPFNIYSSSKSYTSLAYGLLLADSEAGRLPGGKKLTLDTRVCSEEWLPEALPLSDPRKADITLRHLLNMASGIGPEGLSTEVEPFEIALGKADQSPFAQLKSAPGEKFYYSNAGVAHLVLLFRRASGQDLCPYLKERVLDPVGMEKMTWTQIGGQGGKLGPLSQGYSGVLTTPREHARFCYLALRRGNWGGKRVAPASYYDFAWTGSQANPTYGAQWWVGARYKDAPSDMVATLGAANNNGYVVPSLDLVFVRLGSGRTFPDRDFDQHLVRKVLAAVTSPSERWEKEIQAFEEADRKAPLSEGGVLFIGSSSTHLWKTLAQDFPGHRVINRGFGGSQIADSVYFADRIVTPYRPKLIVLQAGGNDINAGKTPQQVLADFKAFVEKVRAKLPDTRIAFLSIHPAPVRWAQAEKQQEANRLIHEYIRSGQNLDYIDLWQQFLGPDGKPREDLFVRDRLHNNAEGYRIRADVVRPHLKSND